MKYVTSRFTVPMALVVALLVGATTGWALATQQQHMYNALQSLKTAYSELNKASSNKGGHRAKAMNLIDQAINEVNLGIQAGNQ
ncbi:MAG TPA: hypothetical protein VMH02_12170 [Verrucomicrobiae bacterium]|nr:hypothetical protein [Verrucomicrobiae bacterium]